MHERTFTVAYREYATLADLPAAEVTLVEAAIAIAQKSYSPYSKFPVGAAVRLDNGETFAGNNQENIAYPSGTCAERTVLNYVHANFPQQSIEVIAITALNSQAAIPVTPCGFCRQVLVEMEHIQGHPIRVLLHKIGGATYAFDAASALLPLAFAEEGLRKR